MTGKVKEEIQALFKCTTEHNFLSGRFQLLISHDHYQIYRNLSPPPASIPKPLSDGTSQSPILTVEGQTFNPQGHKCQSAGVQKQTPAHNP